MAEGKVDVVDREMETVPQHNDPMAVSENAADQIIAVAEKADALASALTKLRTVVLKQALPGDWVEFKEKKKDGEAEAESFLSMAGAGAERVGSFLGISLVNWTDWKEANEDSKGKFYTWFYKAMSNWKGRTIVVEGRASSRDRFFGVAYGKLKDLEDVNENDVRTAARRNCLKEGITQQFGLRRLPRSAAAAMGLDLSKVRTVEFGSAKSGTAQQTGELGDFISVVTDVTLKREKKAEGGKAGYQIMAIKFANGVVAETFDKAIAEKAKELKGKEAFARTEAASNSNYAPKLIEIATATDEHRAHLKKEEPKQDPADAEPKG